MNTKIKNEFKLWIFCLLIGGFAGGVIWTFLKAMSEGTKFIWEWFPEKYDIPYYTVIVCLVGGLIIGIIHMKFGDYPEELPEVFGKLKKNKTYEYRNMLVLLITALLPLLIGSSVGPEAGMTGIIVGLCCWAGDNLKFAKQHSKEYTQVGTAVTLSLLFHSPLFGILSVEENDENDAILPMSTTNKILLYGLAIGAGTGVYMGLNKLFGAGLSGFPSFSPQGSSYKDYLMMIIYILSGCILAFFYNAVHSLSSKTINKLPHIIKGVLGGLCLGIVGTLVPAMMFSGEEQMGELMTEYVHYLPIALIGAAFLKILLTNICIQSGLKGGHFFPVIFAGVFLGYGIALFVFPNGGHEVFGAAVTTAALLGGIMKKPLAVTVLLFLCFPIRMFVWIFVAAAIGARVVGASQREEVSPDSVTADS